MRKYLDIHLEGMDDNGEKLKRILDENIPVAISICPETLRDNGIYSEQYPYLLKFIDLIGEVVSKEGNILGQQGNMHKCKYSHRFADPWHENYCLYNKCLSEDEQRGLMEKGRETLIKLLGKTPEMYVPPNHMFDLTTLKVANNMKYPFFVIKGVKTIEPLIYTDSWNTLVLPETKISQPGHFHYIHYDDIEKNREVFESVIKNIYSFHNIGIDFSMCNKYFRGYKEINTSQLNKDLKTIDKNRKATLRKKILRDIIKFPKRIFH